MSELKRVVLTGGPCAGKTTMLARLSERLSGLGWQVFTVPEVATMLISGGVNLVGLHDERAFKMQQKVLDLQVSLERVFANIAYESGERSVIIHDRGVMDVAAFVSEPVWQALLDRGPYMHPRVGDEFYDAVFHLVTAAIGAREFYTLENNRARSETPEVAAELDRKIQNAWIGHPHFRVIDNSTDFEGKVRRCLAAVCSFLGEPEPLEIERKFLVKSVGDMSEIHSNASIIYQDYLISPPEEVERVRKRGWNGSYVYTHTTKRCVGAGKRIEVERQISPVEYLSYLKRTDTKRRQIRKHRHCFLWRGQYFELDVFIEPEGLVLLEAEVDNIDAPLELPPFIGIEREVTDDPAYSNFALAYQGSASLSGEKE